LTAENHNLPEAENLRNRIQPADSETNTPLPSKNSNAKLLFPPTPIMKVHESNWPLLTVSKGYFEGASMEEERPKLVSADISADLETGDEDAWGMDMDEEGASPKARKPKNDQDEPTEQDEGDGEPGEWDVDLDMGELEGIDVAPAKPGKASQADKFVVLPTSGPSISQIWGSSNLPVDHIAAGSFDSAMALLNQQIGVVNFAPLKDKFLAIRAGATLQVPTLPSFGALATPLYRDVSSGPRATLPLLSLTLESLIDDKLKAGYKAFTNAKFNDSLANFLSILHSLLFIVVDNREDSRKCKELLAICKDYITGLRMEMTRKDASLSSEPSRQAELAAYFTHCNLEPIHLQLALRSAMNTFYKIKNYQQAAGFARRLLDLDPKEDVATMARKVIKFAEQNNDNAITINYNDRNPFVVCGISFTPIYRGSESATCGYCSAAYLPNFKGQLCPTCQLAEIGKSVTGLQLAYVKPESSGKKERGNSGW